MKNEKARLKKKKMLVVGTLFVLFSYIILLGVTVIKSEGFVKSKQTLNRIGAVTNFSEKWTLAIGDTIISSTINGIIDGKNTDKITANKQLPEKIGKNQKLVFSASSNLVNVYVDNTRVYTYDPRNSNNPKYALKVWHAMHLTTKDVGKEVKIELLGFDGSKMILKNLMIGTTDQIIEKVLMDNLIEIIFSVGLIFLGIYLLVVRFFSYVASRNLSKKIYISLLTITIGMWGLLGNDFAFLVCPFYNLLCVFYLLLIALFPLLYLCFIASIQAIKFKKSLNYLLIFSVFINFVTVILMLIGTRYVLALILINSALLICGFFIHFFRSREFYLSNSQIRSYYSYFIIAFIIWILSFISSFIVGIILGIAYTVIALLGYFIFLLAILSIEYILSTRLIENEKILNEKETSHLVSLAYSQIKPHFLHNTLTSIRYLIKSNPEQAYELITDFSEYLRTNLSVIGKEECITWADEIKHIKTYARIEKKRFGDRINIVFIINEIDFKIPALSIQPLVENAIKHGICKRVEGGTVVIKSFRTQNYNVIEVKDDGVGFGSNSIDSSKDHVGLENSTYRLQKMTRASVHVQSAINSGTHVIIKIPIEEFENKGGVL